MAYRDLIKEVFSDPDRYSYPSETDFYNDILPKLTVEQSIVIRMRFGLLCKKKFSRREIGEEMGYTPSKVLRIEHSVLHKFRAPSGEFRTHNAIKEAHSLTPQEWWKLAPWQEIDSALKGGRYLFKYENGDIVISIAGECYMQHKPRMMIYPIAWLPLF